MKDCEERVDLIALFVQSQYIGTMKQKNRPKMLYWLSGLCLLLVLVAGIWLLNVSKPGSEIIACPEACAREKDSAPDEPLRILSLNMLHGFPDFTYLERRVALLSNELGRLDVDIVLLQEVPWTEMEGQIGQLLAQQGGFNYAYLRANGNRRLTGFEEGSVILSRFPLQNLSFTELKPAADFFENRIVLHATVIAGQGPIDLFVTHLTNGEASINSAQADALIAFVQHEATYPAIVAGDFNAVEASAQMTHFGALWQDSFRLAHPESPGATCCVSDLVNSSASELQERVDYLFLVPMAGESLTLVKIERVFAEPMTTTNGSLWLSDHAGLLAVVTLESKP